MLTTNRSPTIRPRKARAKRRRPRMPEDPTHVSHATLIEGRTALSVTLHGMHGVGRKMIVDELQWPRARLAFGDRWGIRSGEGHEYVVAMGARSGMVLARWLRGAQPGQVVTYRNGNALDLRCSNLILEDRGAFVARAFGHPSA